MKVPDVGLAAANRTSGERDASQPRARDQAGLSAPQRDQHIEFRGGGGVYRYDEQHEPPPARQVSDVAVERFEHIFEVDPRLMTVHIAQQLFPNWDTLRIAAGRGDHLEWMHRHWAGTVLSGQELLDEIERESP